MINELICKLESLYSKLRSRTKIREINSGKFQVRFCKAMGYWVVLYQKTLYIPVVLKQNLIYFYTWNGLLYKKMRVRVELLINSRTEYAGCNYISCVPYIMVVCEMVEKLPGSYSYNHLQDNLGCNTLDSLRMMLKFVK